MSQDRRRGGRAAGRAAIVALGLTLGGGALAQPPEVGELLSPEQVRACLCLGQRIDELRQDVALQESLSKEREAELSAIDREIERRRATVNVDGPAAVQELQRLVARQQTLRDLLRTELRGAHRDRVRRLNDRVETFNRLCAGRLTAGFETDRRKANPQCPGS